jgi:thiol-disulfide isomerase/thioredoxin
LLTLLIVGILLFLSGCTSTNTNENSNNGSDDSNWLENYTPVHGIGTGSDDFWIEFPTGNDNYGQFIDHFDWIINKLDNNCVLFVVHRTGCLGCKEQGDLVISLAEKYNEDVEFHDIDAVSDAPEEIQQMSNEAYLYDPNGAPGYIALTGVFTYIEDNGEIKIGWHSWELDVEDSVMESWIKDAIYYYNMNNKG